MLAYEKMLASKDASIQNKIARGAISRPGQSTMVMPDSWVDYYTEKAKLTQPKQDSPGIGSIAGQSLGGLYSDIEHSVLALATMGETMLEPFFALGRTIAGTKTSLKENVIEDVASKKVYEKKYNKDFSNNKDAREFVTSAASAPLWIYGGGKGIQALSKSSSIASRVAANSILGAQVGGIQGALDTVKGDEYGNVGAYLKNAAGGAITGGIVGGASTAAIAPLADKLTLSMAKKDAGLQSMILNTVLSNKNQIAKGLKNNIPNSLTSKATINMTAVDSAKQSFIDQLKKYRKEYLPQYKAETTAGRARQYEKAVKAYNTAIAKGKSEAQAWKIMKGAAGGEFERVAQHEIKLPKKIKELIISDMDTRLTTFEKINAAESLEKLIKGKPITTSELKILEKGMNVDIIPILKGQSFTDKAISVTQQVGGLQRSMMATGELSGTLRQNFTAMARNPIEGAKSFVRSLKYWGSGKGEQNFAEGLAKIKTGENAQSARDYGIVINEVKGQISSRAEHYASDLPEKIPLFGRVVKASERQFAGIGNDIRMRRWDKFVDIFAKQGKTPENDPKLFREIAKLINASTGVGEFSGKNAISRWVNTNRSTLNAILFSPRLIASRLYYLSPSTYFSKSIPAAVRKEAAKDLGSMIAAGATMLATLKAAGADVELDPRSSDFAKAKIGNSRFEVTGGFTPYLRYFAQFITGQKKNTETGKIESTSGYGKSGRLGTATTFARSKLNPIMGTFVDIMAGQDMVGTPTTLPRIVDITPMAYRDAYEAMSDEDRSTLASILSITGGALGFGVGTYGGEKETAEQKQERANVQKMRNKNDYAALSKYYLTGKYE